MKLRIHWHCVLRIFIHVDLISSIDIGIQKITKNCTLIFYTNFITTIDDCWILFIPLTEAYLKVKVTCKFELKGYLNGSYLSDLISGKENAAENINKLQLMFTCYFKVTWQFTKIWTFKHTHMYFATNMPILIERTRGLEIGMYLIF